MNPVLIVEDTHVIASLLVAPEPVRRYPWLGVWVLGAVKECIIIPEAIDTEGAVGGSSSSKPWQPRHWLLNERPVVNMEFILWARSFW
jgi:hypothetical protein